MAKHALFEIASELHRDEHCYYETLPISPTTLCADIAPRLTAHYFDEDAARARLNAAAEELTLFDGSHLAPGPIEIEEALADERDAVLPSSWLGKKPKFLSVERSEFGEIIGSDILETLFGATIPASRILNKEIPDQPTRGADILALENIDQAVVTLLLVEVKGSEETASPPRVVSGMKTKLMDLQGNRRALLQELIWLRDHSGDENAELCARICSLFLFKKQAFRTKLVPLLVRSDVTAQESDPGEFASKPDEFGAPIRWISVRIGASILDTARQAYAIARNGSK